MSEPGRLSHGRLLESLRQRVEYQRRTGLAHAALEHRHHALDGRGE